jgi:hypothetical protein
MSISDKHIDLAFETADVLLDEAIDVAIDEGTASGVSRANRYATTRKDLRRVRNEIRDLRRDVADRKSTSDCA